MNKPSIITIPDDSLREMTTPVTSFGEPIKKQIKLMRQFLKTQDGVGLAANQLGYKNQVFIIEFVSANKKDNIPFQVFINPKIVQTSSEKDELEEGCLSLPQIELPVERAQKIKLRFQNLDGKKRRLAISNVVGRIIQHETDHLNGIIFTDRVQEKFWCDFPFLKKEMFIFVGTGEFAGVILQGLLLLGFNPIIITEKAKPAGRKKELKISAVADVAQKFGRKYLETDDIAQNRPEIFKNKLLICADFGQKISSQILDQTKIAVNIHPSLLPKYRGSSPIPAAILNAEKETGVTIIKMTDRIDEGPILAQVAIEITEQDNSLTLRNRLATASLKLLVKVLPLLSQNRFKTVSQNEGEATLTRKITKEEAEINWKEAPALIERKIRAYYPWPKAYTFIDAKRLIIHSAHLEKDKLVLDIVQEEGRKPLAWVDFQHGWKGKIPKWFDR